MSNEIEAKHAGDPASPDHEEWLLALGRSTYAIARLTGMAFDILRVHGGLDSAVLYNDPLGTLENRLAPVQKRARFAELDAFMRLLGPARVARNDLIHALPTAHGLHRRRSQDASYVRNFYSVSSLDEVNTQCAAAERAGSEALYRDGGAAVRAWYEQAC